MLRVIHGSRYSADSAWVKTRALFISTVSWTWVHTQQDTSILLTTSCMYVLNSHLSPTDLFGPVPVGQERENRGGGGGDRAAGRPQEEISHQVVPHAQRHQPSVEWGAFCLWESACLSTNMVKYMCGRTCLCELSCCAAAVGLNIFVVVMMDRFCSQKWPLYELWSMRRTVNSWDTESSHLMPSNQVGETEEEKKTKTPHFMFHLICIFQNTPESSKAA